MRTALRLWAAATAGLYLVLAYGSYVTLPSHAGGLLGFDMRPLGMSGGMSGAEVMMTPDETRHIPALAALLLLVGWRRRTAHA